MLIRLLAIAALLFLILVALLVINKKAKAPKYILKWLVGFVLFACLAFATYRAIGHFLDRRATHYEVYHKIINSSDDEKGILFREYRQLHLQEMISDNDTSQFNRLFLETIASNADMVVDLWFDEKCATATKDAVISDITFLAGKEGFIQLGWDGGTEIYAKSKGKDSYERILLLIDGDTPSPRIRYAQGNFAKDAPCLIPSGKRETPPTKANKTAHRSRPSVSAQSNNPASAPNRAEAQQTTKSQRQSSRTPDLLDALFKTTSKEGRERVGEFDYDDSVQFVTLHIYTDRTCEIAYGWRYEEFIIDSSEDLSDDVEPVLWLVNKDLSKEVLFSPEQIHFEFNYENPKHNVVGDYTVSLEKYYQKNLREFKSLGETLGLWKDIKVDHRYDKNVNDDGDLSIWDIYDLL